MLPRIHAALVAAVPLAVTACVSPPDDVTAQYVPPVEYQSLFCDQVEQEASRVTIRMEELTEQQKRDRTSDTIATTAGIMLFLPAIFLIDGEDDATTTELARLEGEMEAIRQASIAKGCSI